MKKAKLPRKIKTRPANKTIRRSGPMLDKIPRIKNKMISKDKTKDKNSGTDLSNYILDLMKLT